jgi:hypothetical protein
MGYIDVFGNDHACRDVAAMAQLIGSCPQHRPQDRIHPLERPAACQSLVYQWIDLALLAQNSGNNITKKSCLRR